MIVNEKAIKELGFGTAQNAIGKRVTLDWRGQTYNWSIIGVVKDFHFQDLHVGIEPYAFQLNTPPVYNYLIVHTKAADISACTKNHPGCLA
jgi:putative ABC transport system permease protein